MLTRTYEWCNLPITITNPPNAPITRFELIPLLVIPLHKSRIKIYGTGIRFNITIIIKPKLPIIAQFSALYRSTEEQQNV